MLHMLQYDVANFSLTQSGKQKSAVEQAKQLLEEKPYEVVSVEDMNMVKTNIHCSTYRSRYRIRQNFRGGKLSRLE